MSVKSNSVTASQAEASNISETTNREDKGHNRGVIEWMRRADPARPFLHAGEQTWSYAEAIGEVEARGASSPRLIRPSLTPGSVFDLIAAVSGAGATVVGPEPEVGEPGDSALVVFTSGTSGRPKGVRLTLANLEAAAAASAQHLGHDAADDWLLAMPLNHVGGISIVVRQAYTGGSITMLPGFDAVSFAGVMRGRVTMVSVVPTMLTRLLEEGPFHGLRGVLVGGGPIPEGLLERAAAAGMPVLPTYGMTETFGQVATLRPGAPLQRKAHLIPGMEARIDEGGRIALRGPQVSPGYLGEPDRGDPWFVTKDIGEIDDEGALRIHGRADTMIITGGENVSPERVEAVIGEHPAIDDVVVFGVPDPEWGARVEALYVGDLSPAELGEHVAARLPGHMVPKRFTRVRAIPRTSIGKPDRAVAAELGLGGGD
jgi:O-succinylbenzoic acid--CoA ligase